MVKFNILRFISIIVFAAQTSGCGIVHKVWGEKAPPRKTVTVESEKLPDATNIFNDDEEIAINTLQKYRKSILDSFDKIEGSKKNRLTVDEVQSLARAGLAKLSEKQDTNTKRISSVLTLLGFRKGISREQLIALFDWLENNRVRGKAFYQILIDSKGSEKISSYNLIQMIQFTGSLIALGGDDSLDEKEVINLIEPWMPENYLNARNALPGGIDLINSVFSSLCGDRVEKAKWNAQKNGQCLLALIDHFKSTAPVFDLIFDRINPFTDRQALELANEGFVEKMESWMKGHHHPVFMTQKVATFAEQLNIPTPYHFFQLTEWIPKLNSASTAQAFSPTFFIDVAHLIQNWVSTFIEVTASTMEKNPCVARDWRKCEFLGEYDTADKLFNDEYATLIRVHNLDFIYKISFYDSVADYLIKALDDDGDGLLKDDIKDLITITVRLLDSNAFAQNVINRIQEKPVIIVNTEESIKTLRRQGLAEVAALAADLIPEREGGKRTILKKLTAQVYDAQKYPSYTLDRLGIATFIYVFDLMGNLRSQYMNDYDFNAVTEGPTTLIKRRKVVENLPRMLYDHFPRIYNECLDWGFERTCGVIFTEVLASAPQGKDVLEPVDLDMISLTSILLESMMNRCDRNHNDSLSTNNLDGFDEKHCLLTASGNLATRFMRANILEDNRTTNIILKVMKWLPPARSAAKVALARGTMKGIGLRAVPLISLVSGPAKLGGVISLAAEFMDPDKVDAILAGTVGHHEDAGDELIYSNQLTDKFLPSQQWALRTSAAARILYGPAATISR